MLDVGRNKLNRIEYYDGRCQMTYDQYCTLLCTVHQSSMEKVCTVQWHLCLRAQPLCTKWERALFPVPN